MKITLKMLKQKYSSSDSLEYFAENFGEEADMEDLLEQIEKDKIGRWQIWLAEDFRLSGVFHGWHKGGQLHERCHMKKGQLHGVREEYYRNNQLWERGQWKNGVHHGLQEYWDADGQPAERGHWENGVLLGKEAIE